MLYYVYILYSQKFKKIYIGFTLNLKNRLKEHNSGQSPATKPYVPYELIYYEAFRSKTDAKKREEYLKSGWGYRTIRKMLKSYFNSIV